MIAKSIQRAQISKTPCLVHIQIKSCPFWTRWRTMFPSSHSVHYLARRTCTHDPCRILRSAACGQWCHWLMHVKSFPKTCGTLHLAAIVPIAKAHLQLVKMQPGRDTSALLEGIRCAAATGCAVTGRRFQRSCKDRDHTHAIPWDASCGMHRELLSCTCCWQPFLLLVRFNEMFYFPRSHHEGFLMGIFSDPT